MLDSCPSCGKKRSQGEDTCAGCGLIYAKFEARSQAAPPHSGAKAAPAAIPSRRKGKPSTGTRDTLILLALLGLAFWLWKGGNAPAKAELKSSPAQLREGRERQVPDQMEPWAEPSSLPDGAWRDVQETWPDENPKAVVYRRDTANGPRRIRLVRYFEDGRMAEDTAFDGNLRHGMHRLWYKDGRLRERTKYLRGRKSGLHTVWNTDGTRRCEGILTNGRGKLTCWDDEGNASSDEVDETD